MTDKQIEQMITELESSQISIDFQTPVPVSFNIPEEDSFHNKKSNHQLIKSVLYMSYLIKNGKKQHSSNDYLVDSLETITSIMDNLYLITKLGIGKNSKILKKINKNASKVWFITLIFTIKNLIQKIIMLVQLKSGILHELNKCNYDINSNKLSRIIINKYELKIEEIKQDIFLETFELFGTLNDLLFVSIEIFNWKVNSKLEKLIGLISGFMSIYRMTKRS